jgi:hypothetical protein
LEKGAIANPPKDILVSVDQCFPGGLDLEEWVLLRRVLALARVLINRLVLMSEVHKHPLSSERRLASVPVEKPSTASQAVILAMQQFPATHLLDHFVSLSR